MNLPSETGTTSIDDATLYEAASRPVTARQLWDRWLALHEDRRRLSLAGQAKLARGAASAASAVALQACAQKAENWDELGLKAILSSYYRQCDDADGTHLVALIERAIGRDTDALQGR